MCVRTALHTHLMYMASMCPGRVPCHCYTHMYMHGQYTGRLEDDCTCLENVHVYGTCTLYVRANAEPTESSDEAVLIFTANTMCSVC